MPTVCCAILGPLNNPLYLEVTKAEELDHEEVLKFHSICHCALDSVEEAVSARASQRAGAGAGTSGVGTGKGPGGDDSAYLGLLYPTEEFKVYGYITNTHVKILLVLDDPIVKDEDVRARLEQLHAAYVDAVSNPFYTAPEPLVSAKFEERLRKIIT